MDEEAGISQGDSPGMVSTSIVLVARMTSVAKTEVLQRWRESRQEKRKLQKVCFMRRLPGNDLRRFLAGRS
jgi:hypothetical protein